MALKYLFRGVLVGNGSEILGAAVAKIEDTWRNRMRRRACLNEYHAIN